MRAGSCTACRRAPRESFILLFALYVQFHGDYGPGGGFQAGVITAGMVILFAITFGLRAAQRIAPRAVVERMVPAGVLIFEKRQLFEASPRTLSVRGVKRALIPKSGPHRFPWRATRRTRSSRACWGC